MTDTATPEPRSVLPMALQVNGQRVERSVPVRLLLSDFLRDELGLTGTHVGCEHGICGACTVLLDGEPMRACIALAVMCDGHDVTTVEGLTPDAGLSPLQAAFSRAGGLQCGYCTPGLLATISAADPDDHPDDEAVRALVGGHLCRCTGYTGIVDAVRDHWGRDER